MEIDDRIRERIRQEMQKSGLTAADLARHLGIRHQSITPLLKGERGKIPKSLIDLLDALDLELVVQPKGERAS